MGSSARDIMTREVFTVGPELSLIDLERDLAAHRVTGAPVVEHGKLVGIVSRSDVDRRLNRERSHSAGMATFYLTVDPGEEERPLPDPTQSALEELRHLRVRDVMTPTIVSVPPEAPIRDVARVMDEHRIHRLLVLDGGELRGLISALDLVRVLARGLDR
jgi:CBS domain-containing protein